MFNGVGRLLLAAVLLIGGCTGITQRVGIEGLPQTFAPGTIVDTRSGRAVSYDRLLADLTVVDVIYIGEQHHRPEHHRIQLKIIRSLHQHFGGNSPAIGMEMFARPYQAVLDAWIAGRFDEKTFLQRVHWYATWRFDYDLYRSILDFARARQLPLFGLNLPFHIPAKIAVGGVGSLLPADRRWLPDRIDTTDPDHRAYVADIFKHHRVKGRSEFAFFYEAQCAWEDAMAEAVADIAGRRPLVVLTGNGHIIYGFGVPKRAYQRNPAAFRTVYLASPDSSPKRTYGDYVWITAHESGRKPAVHP